MTPSAGRNLPLAILSGVLLAVAFAVSITLNAYVFLAFVAVLLVVGMFEIDTALRERGLRPATPVAVFAGLLMFFGTYTSGDRALAVGCGVLTLGTLLWVLLDGERRLVTYSVAATLFMTLWVPFLAAFLGLLLARPTGEWYVVTTVAFAVSNDIGAYGVGSAFGRHKMAPAISPGKTWEGFVGGVATVLLLAGLVTPRVFAGLAAWEALVLGGVVAAAATIGDLVESMVKRDLGIKDLGRILPGHGGIMDRVDALLFAIPAAHLVLLALGR
jgi:phosphatidate cytidylyltransferase